MPRLVPLVLVLCPVFALFACSEQAPNSVAPSAGASSSQAAAGVAGSSPSAGGGGAGGAENHGGGAGDTRASGGGSAGLSAAAGGGVVGETGGSAGGTGGSAGIGASLLVFSRTAAYRHDSIPAGVQALSRLATEKHWAFAATEDASTFSDATLAAYNVVIFLSTTGDVLDEAQQAAFERFVRGGKGFVGIHAATDTEYDWAWYGGLVGAYFREHPAVQAANVVVEDAAHPATVGLPNPWHRTDEWYSFKSNPRPNVHVLLSLDESSYGAGSSNMSGDHPIAWCHEYDGGRAFYTALGHTSESFSDPLFIGQLAGAVAWVLAR